MAEVQTKESQSAVQAALEERKRKEDLKKRQQEERERKERELEIKLRQKHFEDEKREQERQKRKEQEKQAIEQARQRREEEQRNHLLGKKPASKWPSSSSHTQAREDVRKTRMPLEDEDEGPSFLTREEKRQRKQDAEWKRQFAPQRRTPAAGGYGKTGRRLPGGAVDVTASVSSSDALQQSPGKTVRERLTAMPNTLTRLNVNKRDTRTIDEILQDRAKAKEAKVLDGESAKGFNDWFSSGKKAGSGTNTPTAREYNTIVHYDVGSFTAYTRRNCSRCSNTSTIKTTALCDAKVHRTTFKLHLARVELRQSLVVQTSKSSAVAQHSSGNSSGSRPIPTKKRLRSLSMSESPPPPKKRATPPGGGAGGFRDEIWALFGKSRREYVDKTVDSDDDMEAGASDLEKEEKYRCVFALSAWFTVSSVDEIIMEKREQEEKERRRARRKPSCARSAAEDHIQQTSRLNILEEGSICLEVQY
ncbi:Protein spt [Salix suchowensis]|nr:Protein spt [Salix suchowensis]